MRADLPSGTVTFLFTDVEGSTKLLHELGAEAYAEALVEHRRDPRPLCCRGRGRGGHAGRRLLPAFPTAPGAIAAAEAMTEALAAGPIQVRIGLHTGTPLLTERATSVTTSTSSCIAPRRTEGRSFSRVRLASCRRRSCRARRAPPQGHRAAGLDLPARQRALPAAEHDL